MGFFLSEHTTSLDEDKNRVDLSSPLSKIEKLTLIGQLYASRLTGRFVIKQDKKKEKVCLDIDLLVFDDRILRPEDLQREYVRKGLEELK